ALGDMVGLRANVAGDEIPGVRQNVHALAEQALLGHTAYALDEQEAVVGDVPHDEPELVGVRLQHEDALRFPSSAQNPADVPDVIDDNVVQRIRDVVTQVAYDCILAASNRVDGTQLFQQLPVHACWLQ